jgi:hypothetical protein
MSYELLNENKIKNLYEIQIINQNYNNDIGLSKKEK